MCASGVLAVKTILVIRSVWFQGQLCLDYKRFCERLRRSALYFVLLQNTPQLEVQSLCFFFCGRPGAGALLQIF